MWRTYGQRCEAGGRRRWEWKVGSAHGDAGSGDAGLQAAARGTDERLLSEPMGGDVGPTSSGLSMTESSGGAAVELAILYLVVEDDEDPPVGERHREKRSRDKGSWAKR